MRKPLPIWTASTTTSYPSTCQMRVVPRVVPNAGPNETIQGEMMAIISPNAVDRQRRRSRYRLPQLLIACLAAVGITGVIGLTAVPASAAQTCNKPVGSPSDLCLWIDGIGSGMYRIHVGIDVFM